MSENAPTRAAAEAAAPVPMLDVVFRGRRYRIPKDVQHRGIGFTALNAEGKHIEALETIIGKTQTQRFIQDTQREVVFVEGEPPEKFGPVWEDYNAFFDAIAEVTGGNS